MHLEIVNHGLELYTLPLAKLDRVFPREDGAYIIKMFGDWGVRPLPNLPATIETGRYVDLSHPELIRSAPDCYLAENASFQQCALAFSNLKEAFRLRRRQGDRLFGNLFGKALISSERQLRQPLDEVSLTIWRLSDWIIRE